MAALGGIWDGRAAEAAAPLVLRLFGDLNEAGESCVTARDGECAEE